MQEWWKEFKKILDDSKIKYLMNALYVDDGRILIELLRKGVRFDGELKLFRFDEKWLEEDELNGKTDAERTEREVREAMNSVSPDLIFTTETENDFANGRLPTLAFQMWSERSGLRHSFYEKEMRSQILTHKKSSQSEQSKYSILENELTRRFEVLDKDIENDEKVAIVDHYTQQLLDSGYSIEHARECHEQEE